MLEANTVSGRIFAAAIESKKRTFDELYDDVLLEAASANDFVVINAGFFVISANVASLVM